MLNFDLIIFWFFSNFQIGSQNFCCWIKLPLNRLRFTVRVSLAYWPLLTTPTHLFRDSTSRCLLSTQSRAHTSVWIPGDIDFSEHNEVHLAAKQVPSFTTITIKYHFLASDYKPLPLPHLQDVDYPVEKPTSNKLLDIKKTLNFWSTSDRYYRREKVILTGLGTRYPFITHSFKINSNTLFSPVSTILSGKKPLSLTHLWYIRLQPLRSSLHILSCISQALKNNPDTVSLFIQFLLALNSSLPSYSIVVYTYATLWVINM